MIDKFVEYFEDKNLMPREQQIEVLLAVAENWDKKYFYIDAPVGVGKTHIALAIADQCKDSYFLTSTKMLQEQYLQSSAKIVSLKGRGNYRCNIDRNFAVDAAPCLADRKLKRQCIIDAKCDYYKQKSKALASKMMITNYQYFLYATHCGPLAPTDSDDGNENPWQMREALIMDEAHELESCLIAFAETKIMFQELYEQHGIGTDDWVIGTNAEENFSMMQLIITQANSRINALKDKLEGIFSENHNRKSDSKMVEKVQKLNLQINTLDKMLQPLQLWVKLRDGGNWVETPNVEENSLMISPLTADMLFEPYMGEMAEKYFFMSATMGSPEILCKELGINKNEMCVVKVGTPFDPALSPITILPIAKTGYKDLDRSMPALVSAIESILDHHKDEKGIIHSGNYRIAKMIQDTIGKEYRPRLLTRDMHGENQQSIRNDQLMKMHNSNDDPTVLLSPSMTTGIDLYDDLARFQIIVKLPFLSLGDPRVKKKSDLDSKWYRSKMWIQVMQATGRATRYEDDHAETYILDSSFDYFYQMDYSMLAQWFKDRVEVSGK